MCTLIINGDSMAYVEIKTIKGKQYRYERVSVRIGKRVTHSSKYLGPVEPVNKRRNLNAGRKPKLKVRELTDKEKEFVKQNIKSSKSFLKDRAKIITLSSEGKTVKEITNATGFHRPKIEKIIKEFNEKGDTIFVRKKSPGKPRRITAEQRTNILQYLNTDPKNLGLHFTNWSLNNLAEYANKKEIKISASQVSRIIKKDNIKYKKKVSWLYSNDPEFSKKNKS